MLKELKEHFQLLFDFPKSSQILRQVNFFVDKIH